MKSFVALSLAAGLLIPAASFAVQSCPDRAPAAITAPGGEGGKDCQAAIAKAASGFVKAKLKTQGKCMSQ